MLVVETVGAFQKDSVGDDYQMPADAHRMTRNLGDILDWLRSSPEHGFAAEELLECYHDVVEIHREAAALFGMGYLALDQNALIERMYWSSCAAILKHLRVAEPDPQPPEYFELEEKLVDHYLINFSVFQSMLDHWAIDQPFPVMPLARLDKRPTRRTLLVDLTCDSDGKISQYVSSKDDRNFLELHALEAGEPYYLGVFMMGAYQDIMGDAHNLFGRVSEIHVYADADEDNNFWLEKIIPGTEIEDILATVQYFPNDLRRRMQDIIKQKMPENNGGYTAISSKENPYGKIDKRVYSELTTDNPIDLCRYQVANCYMGRCGLINSGGASGENDFAQAVRTAVINKRAGGCGLISGRKAFQKPMKDGVELLNTIQDVYLCEEIGVA